MEIEYFMSSLASDVMGILTENFLWMRTLGSTPILESEVPHRTLFSIIRWTSSRIVVSTTILVSPDPFPEVMLLLFWSWRWFTQLVFWRRAMYPES